jgi:hypothetical protein
MLSVLQLEEGPKDNYERTLLCNDLWICGDGIREGIWGL